MPVLSGRFELEYHDPYAAEPEGKLREQIFGIAERTKMHRAYAEFCAAYYDPQGKAIIANLGRAQAYVVMCNAADGKKILYPLNNPNRAVFGDVDDVNKNVDFNIYDLNNIHQYLPAAVRPRFKDYQPSQIIIVPSERVFKEEFTDRSIIGVLLDDGKLYYGHSDDAVAGERTVIEQRDLSENPENVTFLEIPAPDETAKPQCAFLTSSQNDVLCKAIQSSFLGEQNYYWNVAAEEILQLLQQNDLYKEYDQEVIRPINDSVGRIVGFQLFFPNVGWYGVCSDPEGNYGFTFAANAADSVRFIVEEDQRQYAKNCLHGLVEYFYDQQNPDRIAHVRQQMQEGNHFAQEKILRELRHFETARETRRSEDAARARREMEEAARREEEERLRARLEEDMRHRRLARAERPEASPAIKQESALKITSTFRNYMARKSDQEALLKDAGYNPSEVKTLLDKQILPNSRLKDLIEGRKAAARVLPPLPSAAPRDERPHEEGAADRPGPGERERPSSSMSMHGGASRLGFSIDKRHLLDYDPDPIYAAHSLSHWGGTGPGARFPEIQNFFDPTRKNKFKILASAYDGENKERKGFKAQEMMRHIVFAASHDPFSGHNMTTDEFLRAVKYAKKYGGLGSDLQDRVAEKLSPRDSQLFRDFSQRFQRMCEECGIYSGKEGSFVGLRLAYLPTEVIGNIADCAELGNAGIVSHKQELVAAQKAKVTAILPATRAAEIGI